MKEDFREVLQKSRVLIVTDRPDDGTMCRLARRYAQALRPLERVPVAFLARSNSEAGLLPDEWAFGARRFLTGARHLVHQLKGWEGVVIAIPQLVAMAVQAQRMVAGDCAWTNVPVYCHPPSLAPHSDPFRQHPRLVRALLGQLEYHLAISPGTAMDAQKNIFSGREVRIVPPPYESSRPCSLRTFDPSQRPLRLLWLGHHRPLKGPDLAIRAVARINQGRSPICVTMTMVGGGDYLQDSRSLVRHLKADDSIQVVGRVESVENYLDRSDILLATSHEEGFGQYILEAMAHANAVISTPALGGGVQYLLQDGAVGVLLSSFHVSEIVQALEKVINEPEMLEHLSRLSADRASSFTFERVGSLMHRTVKEVLA